MHELIVGMSGSGKSRLLKQRTIPAYRRRGRAVLVLDPVGVGWMEAGATWTTADPYAFLRAAQASRGCVLVIDECDEMIRGSAQLERDLKYLATRARNDGHLSLFACQRALQLPPSYREQCSSGWLWHQLPDSAACCAQLFGRPELVGILPRLWPGEVVRVAPYRPLRRLAAFPDLIQRAKREAAGT